jgi:hypothetical protein
VEQSISYVRGETTPVLLQDLAGLGRNVFPHSRGSPWRIRGRTGPDFSVR